MSNKYLWSWVDGTILLQHGERFVRLGPFPADEMQANRDNCLAWAFERCRAEIDVDD